MKKILSVFLIAALVFALAACGGNEKQGDGGDAKLKVGFIFIGSINDGGYTQAHYDGMKAAEKHFKGEIETLYLENVSDTDKQASLDAARNLIDQGCNVVVGCSYGYMDALGELADKDEYKNVKFLHFSGNQMNDSNFGNFFGAMEEARYLTGMIAGSMTKSNKIGYVAAHPYTEVIIGINAFTLGVQSVNKDATVKVVYINSWGDPELEKTAAEQLLAAGCDVLTQHSDSTAPQLAAQEKGAFAIGYNYDNPVAEKAYLTSAIWHHDSFLIDTFKAVMDNTWKPESYYGTIADGYIGIGKMTKLVPSDVQEKVNAKLDEMKSGEFTPFSGKIEFADGGTLCEDGKKLTRDEIWSLNTKLIKGAEGTK